RLPEPESDTRRLVYEMETYTHCLALTERHIAESTKRIEEQRTRVLDMQAHGQDSSFSHKLLATFIYSLANHHVHRELLLRLIAIHGMEGRGRSIRAPSRLSSIT